MEKKKNRRRKHLRLWPGFCQEERFKLHHIKTTFVTYLFWWLCSSSGFSPFLFSILFFRLTAVVILTCGSSLDLNILSSKCFLLSYHQQMNAFKFNVILCEGWERETTKMWIDAVGGDSDWYCEALNSFMRIVVYVLQLDRFSFELIVF